MARNAPLARTTLPALLLLLLPLAFVPASLLAQTPAASDSAAGARSAAAATAPAASAAAVSPGAAASGAARPTLSLEEALRLARENSPVFLQQANDEAEADWRVREAYGQLLPSASIQGALQYQAPGTPNFGIFSGQQLGISKTSSIYYSSYSLALGYRLSGAELFAPAEQKAARRATLARIDAAAAQLGSDVKTQYLAMKRAEDARTLAQQELERAQETLKLAEARVAVGSAIPLEAKQAEVAVGRAEVTLLSAEQQQTTERLRLSEQLGLELPPDVELTTSFAPGAAPLALDAASLVALALRAQPQLRSARAQASSASAGVKAAKTQYLPTLALQLGWSGSARESGSEAYVIQQAKDQLAGQASSCELLNQISAGLSTPLPNTPGDCSLYAWTPDKERAVLANNRVFPFNYTAQPMYAQLTVSLPIFSGFSRERQVESARVLEDDARQQVRAQELAVRTGVQAGVAAVETARRTVEIETKNRSVAAEQLKMQRERYRVGAASFLELSEAETIQARAERSYLDAIYAYQEALASLEATVGAPLTSNGGK